MKQAFSREGMKNLAMLSKKKCLYAFDFDGTLAKIGNIPSAARMNKVTFALLTKLSHIAPIAIISGRSVTDLQEVLQFDAHHVIGNHGLEGIDDYSELQRSKSISQKWIKTFSSQNFEKEIEVEDKVYSLTIHYRLSKNKKNAKEQIEAAIKLLNPAPRMIAGKWMLNLTPQNATHKGEAVLALMKKTDSDMAFFIGDDVTDEDVFRLKNKNILTVRVGRKKRSEADFYIERQSEINRLLQLLVKT